MLRSELIGEEQIGELELGENEAVPPGMIQFLIALLIALVALLRTLPGGS